jgi:hypothetical protein
MVRSSATTASIRAEARELLDDPRPHIRSAAARVLYAYDDATLGDVLTGIARLQTETDPDVRAELLGELSVAGRGQPLTVEQARPLIDALRQWSQTPGGGWAAAELAQWSAEASDLEFVLTLLDAASDAERAQQILNAFARETRLAGAHEVTARDVLLGVLADRSRHASVRSLALGFLYDYAPWDDATAEVVRRHGTD